MADTIADCHASGTVRAAAWAVKDDQDFTLCAHCVGVNRRTLEAQGWTIIAMTLPKRGAGVGTESTGVHFALEQP